MKRTILSGFALLVYACGGSPQVKVENPTELYATGLALSSEVKTQASKLAEANLVKSSGIAGGTSSGNPPSMGLAGAGGGG